MASERGGIMSQNQIMCELSEKPCIYQSPDDPFCNVWCPVYRETSLSKRAEVSARLEKGIRKFGKEVE